MAIPGKKDPGGILQHIKGGLNRADTTPHNESILYPGTSKPLDAGTTSQYHVEASSWPW